MKLTDEQQSKNHIKMIKFLIPFILFQVSNQAASLGALIYRSMNSIGLYGPAMVALIQSLSNVGALILANFVFRNSNSKSIFYAAFAFCLINTLTTFSSTDITLTTLFMRLLFGSLTTGIFLSIGPRVISNDIKSGTQIIQTWSTFASLIGFGLAPIIGQSLKSLFTFDFGINLVATITMVTIAKSINFTIQETEPLKEEISNEDTEQNSKNYLVTYVAISTLIFWLVGGIFHVVEVPLLLHRFNFSNTQVSLLFIGTLLVNITTVAYFNKKIVNQFSWVVLYTSIALSYFASGTYLYTYSIYAVIFCLAIIGITNGAYNLSQATILQRINSPQKRLHGFIVSRLAAQLGILFGALIAGTGMFFQIEEKTKSNGTINTQKIEKLKVFVEHLPDNLEPHKITDVGAMLVARQVIDNLFEYDSRNNLVPKLVDSLVWKNKSKTLEISIRKNVMFSDGTPLLAQDVFDSLNREKTELGKSGNWAFGELKDIEVIDQSHLKFNFKKQFTLFPSILAAPYFGIYKIKDGKVIGTGEYELSKIKSNTVVLVKNKIKNQNDSAPEEIHFSDSKKPSFNYDITQSNINNNFVTAPTTVRFRTLLTVVFKPNFNNPILKSKKNRCNLINKLTQIVPQAYPTWKPVDIGLPFSSGFFPKNTNEDKITSNNMNKIVILFSNSAAHFEDVSNGTISKKLDKQGFHVEFEQVSINELTKRAQTGTKNSFMWGYIPDFVHPHALIAPLLSSSQAFNYGNYSNSEIDRLLDLAGSESDKIKQGQLYAKILRIAQDDCAIAFLGTQDSAFYARADLNFPEMGQLGFYTLDIAKVFVNGDSK